MSTQETGLTAGSVFLDTYEIVAELGTGSYGSVYHGRHVATGRDVALKLLRLHGAASTPDTRAVAERFRHEMRLNAQLWHPNIARLHDWGEVGPDTAYAVFDLIPGTTLRAVLEKEGRLATTEAVHLMRQVLDALSCAHAHQIVHRDLKPENIMITRTGARRNAVVVDFGAGGLADQCAPTTNGDAPVNELIGSPCYAAPEQLQGAAPLPRSDLYSWGLIFIECLTGTVAVDGATPEDVVMKQLSAEPIVLPSWLMQHGLGPLLRAVTTKDPARRVVSTGELLTALATAETGGVESTPPRYGVAPEESERRQLTVVSCRFSVCGEPREAEEVDLLLHEQQSRCADLAMRHGGQIAGVMADRVMLTFGYPHAREDDARRGVRTALQIVDQLGESARGRLAAHIGVHSGIVMVRARRAAGRHTLPHLLGLTPRMAQSVDALAPAGEVLLSVDTVRLLRGRIDTEATGAVASAEGLAPRAVFRLQSTLPRGERMAPPAETPFIGRGRQLDTLVEAWTRAEAGRPAALLIHGEPGIGKSRLVRELRRYVPLDGWLESRCLPESQATPLAPLIDQLNLLTEPLDTVLARYGFVLEETVPLLTTLLSRPADSRYPGEALSADRRKEQTLALLVDLLLRMAEAAPTAFVLEDLQWADPTTLELVDLVVRAVRERREPGATKLSVILTARPDFAPPWPSDDVTVVSLTGLSEREVASMITKAVARDGSVPPAVIEEVVRRADGVPLFVEEVTRVLAESGSLSAGGAVRASMPIPVTLRDLLMQRLDGLSPPARQTAQLAGVLGREFRFEVLEAVSTVDVTELREHLSELEIAGLITHRHGARVETYVFRHALLRDAAYDSLVRAVRQPLHHRVATALREHFPEIAQQRPETLALHFEQGGEPDTAIDYWHRAGSRALHRAAYQEALTLLQRGLGLIAEDALAPDQGRRRVQLLSTLGSVLISTKGYSTIEVQQTFERASTLCGDMEGEIPNDVLYGLWGVHITRSDRRGTDAIIPIFERIMARTDDPVSVLTASACLGTACYWQAQLETAERHFLHGRRLFDTDQFQRFAQTFGYGVGLYSYAFGQLTLWLLGYPDRAEHVRQELLAISARVRDPYCSAVALGFAMTLAHDRDEPAVELDYADRLALLAREQRLPVWAGISQIGRGGAFARLGAGTEAIGPLQEGLQTLRQVGIMCSYNYFLPYLAEALLNAGRFEDALATLAESTELCGTLVARLHETEILRLQGAVLLRRDGTGDGNATAVERWYQRARTMARAIGARSYELRIALDLAELWRDHGRDREAVALLDEIDGRFSEGRTTPDLRAAAALRQELGSSRS